MPQPLVKYVLHWSGLGEEGQVGWYVAPGGACDHSVLDSAVGTMKTKAEGGSAWLQTLCNWLSTDQAFDSISAYYYADGSGAADDQAFRTIASNKGTGTGLSKLPLQTAVCVSLHTGRPGASYRGRMYLPATGMPIGGHRFAATDLNTLALQIMGSDGASPVDGMLWDSERALASVSAGFGAGTTVIRSGTKHLVTGVTSITIDDIPDTQRRRAQSLKPTFKASASLARAIPSLGTLPTGP